MVDIISKKILTLLFGRDIIIKSLEEISCLSEVNTGV